MGASLGISAIFSGINAICWQAECSQRIPRRLSEIIQIDPGHRLAINQGLFMDAIIFRKREHLFERQRVVRTLKMMASMGPIARLWTGSMGT